MNRHYQLNDVEFEKKFEDCSLEPTLFNHEAHLRLAWIYIKQYGEPKAIKKVCSDIKRFDQVHGSGNKFHVTVTVAAVKAINHFMQKSNSKGFQNLILEFPRLKTAFNELLDQHYGYDIFSNKKAKVEYLEPDLLPF